MKKYKIFFYLLLITLLHINNVYSQDTLLLKLINNFENSDGESFFEYGEKISVFFLEYDTLFFQTMENNKVTFYKWLNEIQYHTFTIYYYIDNKDLTEKKCKLKELKSQMLIKAKNIKKRNSFGGIVKDFIKKLQSIKIRVVDQIIITYNRNKNTICKEKQ